MNVENMRTSAWPSARTIKDKHSEVHYLLSGGRRRRETLAWIGLVDIMQYNSWNHGVSAYDSASPNASAYNRGSASDSTSAYIEDAAAGGGEDAAAATGGEDAAPAVLTNAAAAGGEAEDAATGGEDAATGGEAAAPAVLTNAAAGGEAAADIIPRTPPPPLG